MSSSTDNLWNEFWYQLLSLIFRFAILLYFLLSLIETVFPGSVRYFFNLSGLLVVVIILGVSMFAVREFPRRQLERVSKRQRSSSLRFMVAISGAAGTIGAFLLFLQLPPLGVWRLGIPIIGGILIGLCTTVLLHETNTTEDQHERQNT